METAIGSRNVVDKCLVRFCSVVLKRGGAVVVRWSSWRAFLFDTVVVWRVYS